MLLGKEKGEGLLVGNQVLLLGELGGSVTKGEVGSATRIKGKI